MAGREQRPRNRRLLAAGKAARLPATARKSRGGGGAPPFPRMAGRERPMLARATRRTICAKPGGATSSRKTPTETAKTTELIEREQRRHCDRNSTETEAAARKHASGGPAKRRTSPNGGPGDTVASVSFMITKAQKAELRARGFSTDQIAQLTPQQAHEILVREA